MNALTEKILEYRGYSWTDAVIKQQFQIAEKLSEAVIDAAFAEADAPKEKMEVSTTVEQQPIVTVVVPEYETPAHEEIDLATADPEALGLDLMASDADAQLMDAIVEAKRRAALAAIPSEGLGAKVSAPMIDGRPAPLARDIAAANIAQGSYVIFFPRGQKGSKEVGWDEKATRDIAVVEQYCQRDPYANVGLVGKPDGNWYFDDDQNILAEYESVHGKIMTRRNRSVSGGTHLIFKQNNLSREMGNISGKSENGEETWSVRQSNKYIVAAGSSAHPNNDATLPQHFYENVENVTVIEAPAEFIHFLQEKHNQNPKASATPDSLEPVVAGGRNNFLASMLGKARQSLQMGYDDLLAYARRLNQERCQPALADAEVEQIAHSIGGYEIKPTGEIEFTQPPAKPVVRTPGVYESSGDRLSHDQTDEFSEACIPAFDPSVMKGIYKEIADAVTRGTTLAPQYAYSIAKTIVGAKMAGTVMFEDLDVMPLEYLVNCGPTGAGKGEAWRRIYKIMTAKPIDGIAVTNKLSCAAGIKVLNSADSGAGLRDAFFEFPDTHPIVCYIDETASLGHKADSKKNPEIIDAMGELADSTSITRAKAKKSGRQPSVKTKDDAYLAVVMCAQNNEVLTSAFVGRTNVGWFDRLTPEYGVPQEPGDLPAIDETTKSRLLAKLNNLGYSGTMNTSLDATHLLHEFWLTLPAEVRTVARFKKHIKLDAYLMAFGRGLRTVEVSDMEDAIKIFKRQLCIRRVMFRGEVPNRVGFYLGLIKQLTEWMRRRLKEGIAPDMVARSWRDYERKTNAHRNNEEDIFTRAMDNHARHHLVKVTVKSKNGSNYERYLPMAEDE